RTSIAFSPADRPLVTSRSARFRTTSATWYTSPLFNFSWWFLNRRLQLVGSRTSFLPSSWNRSSTSSAEIGGRMPTSSTLSVGTESVMSPCAIFRMRYSRFSPATSIISFFSMTAAPWCGYTTRSPTLKGMPLLVLIWTRGKTTQSTRRRVPALSPDASGRDFGAALGCDPRLDDRREIRRVVRVLFRREQAVARVLQHGEVVGLVQAAVARIDEAVLDLADPPAARFVAHAPVVRELLHLGVRPLRH